MNSKNFIHNKKFKIKTDCLLTHCLNFAPNVGLVHEFTFFNYS